MKYTGKPKDGPSKEGPDNRSSGLKIGMKSGGGKGPNECPSAANIKKGY